MVTGLQIGKLRLATNLVLAPIAGYTELAFRLVVRRCGGVGLAFTPLLAPRGLIGRNAKSAHLATTCAEDSPLAMQFFGAETDWLCEAARWAEDRGADIVDINMGCSVHKVTGKNGGSRLLCDPENAARMAERIVRSLRHTPLTVKMRIGWDEASIVAPELAARLEGVGVAAVTVHGRTAAMKFSGRNRLDVIAEAVGRVRSIPVIGNGDVRSPQDAERMLAETGCAGVMIGRAALSAPWILRDTWSYLTTGVVPPPPSVEEKCRLMREHFYGLVGLRGERVAVLEFRKAGPWYARQMPAGRVLRAELSHLRSAAEFERVLSELPGSGTALQGPIPTDRGR